MFNSLLGKAKEKKEQKLLEKREKYYRSEILPEIRKIVQGEFVTSKIGVVNKIDKTYNLSKEDLIKLCGELISISTRFRKIANSFDSDLKQYLNENKEIQNAYNNFMSSNKSSDNFEYNGNLYFLDIIKEQLERNKKSSLFKGLLDEISSRDETRLINDINNQLASIRRCENILIPSMMVTPQLILNLNYIITK